MTIENYRNKIIQGDCLEVMREMPENCVDAVITDPPYGLSFMGKKWDYDVPSVEVWAEALRVLKPGGHLLAFSGTRTQHRMAVRIEDAGFEIRDMIAWVYGSGMPKGLNIGKAVDRFLGNTRQVVGKTQGQGTPIHNGNFKTGSQNITKGTSEFEGWGTTLKPALEPITMARKPLLEKTVSNNVLRWGTGGINIDGCKIGTEERTNRGMGSLGVMHDDNWKPGDIISSVQGRFPANLIHDGSDEVLAVFPQTKSGKSSGYNFEKSNQDNPCHFVTTIKSGIHFSDSGSASRFFYCAKANKAERNAGLEEFEKKYSSYTEANPSPNRHKRNDILSANIHPTVKPIALMQYLIRLIAPPNNPIILDMFGGSGTTGIAAIKESVDYILIERELEYCKIAEARIAAASL